MCGHKNVYSIYSNVIDRFVALNWNLLGGGKWHLLRFVTNAN